MMNEEIESGTDDDHDDYDGDESNDNDDEHCAMQIKICDHNLIHRVRVDLVFVLFFCPFPQGPVSV